MRAARAAERVHAFGEAAALFERAIELWHHVPDAAARAGIDHVELLASAANVRYLAGEESRAETLLRAALEEVDEAPRPPRAAALLERLSAVAVEPQPRQGGAPHRRARARAGHGRRRRAPSGPAC